MNKPVATRKVEILAWETPDPNYPPEDGRTVVQYSRGYVPINSKPYPLKKKYR